MSSKRDIRYWTGVLNTIKLINRFVAWKSKNPYEKQSLEDLLIMMKLKAEQKIGVEEDLADELGVSYLSEPRAKKPVSESTFSLDPSVPEPAAPTTVFPPEPAVSEPVTPEPTIAESVFPPEPAVSEPVTPEPTIAESAFPPEPTTPEPTLPPEHVTHEFTVPEPTVPSSDFSFPAPSLEVSSPTPPTPPQSTPAPESTPEQELSPELLNALRDEEPPSPPTPSPPSAEKEEDEDLLSSSLRAALKMLRGDEED